MRRSGVILCELANALRRALLQLAAILPPPVHRLASKPVGAAHATRALLDAVRRARARTSPNCRRPGSIRKINTGRVAFMQMENLHQFLRVATALGALRTPRGCRALVSRCSLSPYLLCCRKPPPRLSSCDAAPELLLVTKLSHSNRDPHSSVTSRHQCERQERVLQIQRRELSLLGGPRSLLCIPVVGFVARGLNEQRAGVALLSWSMLRIVESIAGDCKFLAACTGVAPHACFQPPDLYEKKNMSQVIGCLLALKVRAPRARPVALRHTLRPRS